eukprot:NODE_18_length_40692_cov_0.469183.p11 type:complete len:342 gc:universal NODE_18_length_40692_cov_0.469183:1560-535(-)
MGAVCSGELRRAKQRNQDIEDQLMRDAEKYKRECKILLLGAGESGKSTIVRQMKIIHMNGYNTQESLSFKPTIYANIVLSIKLFTDALVKLGLNWRVEKNKKLVKRFQELTEGQKDTNQLALNQEHADIITSLWSDPVVQEALKRSSEFYLLDSAPYFFSEVKRICQTNYVPNEQDILRARIKTTGIVETRFHMGQLAIHMFDVGGQRSERKKWIHCFEGVTSVIFITSLSEYDQSLLEDSKQNRMNESIILFESVINSRWFVRSSMILFLNKVDLFKAKLPQVPLEKYFPDYSGGDDFNKATKYVLGKFSNVNRAKLKIYPHLTCATDTSNIRLGNLLLI